MNILTSLFKILFGANLKEGSGRAGMLLALGAGWVMGDRLGLPEPIRAMIDAGLESVGGMIAGQTAAGAAATETQASG